MRELVKKIENVSLKICGNKFISSLQDAMLQVLPVILVGSIFQICATLFYIFDFDVDSFLFKVVNIPYNFSMGLIGLFVTILLSYNYAKKLKIHSPMGLSMQATMIFIMVACFDINNNSVLNIEYLGAMGMFIGFVISFSCAEIDKAFENRRGKLDFSEAIPPSFTKFIESIFPIIFNALIWVLLSMVIFYYSEGKYNCASLFMQLITKPLMAITSVPGIIFIGLLAGALWTVGIHGTSIINALIATPLMMAISQNAEVYENVINNGGSIQQAEETLCFAPCMIFTAICMVGGTGNTLALCLLGLGAKSKKIRNVAKTAIIPGIFGINEPVTFGMPIFYNPILAIPYLINIFVVMILTYLGYMVGILVPPHIYVGVVMPIGIGEFIGSLNFKNALWPVLMLIPTFIVWYPFFRKYDEMVFAQEQIEEQLQ